MSGQVGRHSLIAVTDDGGRSWKQTWRSATGREVTRVIVAGANSAWAEIDACATCRHRLLHSTDGGKTWVHVARNRLSDVSFINDTEGWALWKAQGKTSDRGGNPGIRVLVKQTHDGGRTWTRVSSACRHGYWIDAALSRTGAGEGWIVCAGDIGTAMQKKVVIHTVDSGSTWQRPGDALWSGHLTGVLFRSTDHGWLWLNRAGLLRTDDGARTWDSNRFFESDVDFISSVCFVDNENGYATYQNGDRGAQQFIVTHDGGRTWRVRQTWH
jgi:photosystem II stability/assembly factor-like uncharacterized protein